MEEQKKPADQPEKTDAPPAPAPAGDLGHRPPPSVPRRDGTDPTNESGDANTGASQPA